MVFERKTLRKIFGPTKERDGTLRIKTNKLIIHKNIINHVKAQSLSWFGHLQRMVEERMVMKVYNWKPMLTRPLERPENQWRTEGGFGVFKHLPPPIRNSEVLTKSNRIAN